jgi:hypothetical protein
MRKRLDRRPARQEPADDLSARGQSQLGMSDPEASDLLRHELGPSLERWEVIVAPRSSIATRAHDWKGAIVLVAQGTVEVCCLLGGRSIFMAGDLLALSCLPVESICNSTDEPALLIAVRRRLDSAVGDPGLGSDT